ncbi:MAG: hypothetical protein FWG85_00395 [Bacteroidetes bacterium]|nr:hypothetical protein [Bacteroidota bacterium]
MQEWINSILGVDQAGIVVFPAVFLLGIISVFTCACNLAMLGSVAGYTSSMSATTKTKTLLLSSVFFLMGVVVSMSIIGCLIGYAGGLFVESLGNYWNIVAGIVIIFLGVYMLDILPFKLPTMLFKFENKNVGIASAILLGITVGGATALHNMCCNPIYPFIIATIFVKGDIFGGFLMMLFYAFGYGGLLASAMLGVGLGLGKISKMLNKFSLIVKYVGGITLIILGFYFLITG